MPYFPTIELTPQVSMLLARGALRLNPGQWVKGEKGRGRFLRTDPRNGTPHVSWLRPGDSWETAAQRFHRACRKGFVGKYRHLYGGGRGHRSMDGPAAKPVRWKGKAGDDAGRALLKADHLDGRP